MKPRSTSIFRARTGRASTTSRWSALVLAAALFSAPLAACGRDSPPPPVDDTTQAASAAPEKTGMSTGKKVVLLAGAAALYYLYKKHKDAAAQEGPDGQYYLSKNGRVYYRDAEHRAHWVTPPPGGIAVPASEAAEYREFQGYDNQTSGHDLTGLAADPAE
jgi:predicted small lipoprotein YifL